VSALSEMKGVAVVSAISAVDAAAVVSAILSGLRSIFIRIGVGDHTWLRWRPKGADRAAVFTYEEGMLAVVADGAGGAGRLRPSG
jgi:hypothetical protein